MIGAARSRSATAVSILALVSLMASGCAPRSAEAGFIRSDIPRDTAPQVPEGDLGELVAGNTAFAWDLYQALRSQPGNLFYSPYSISIALAMTYAGARGVTEEEMARVLHYTLPQDRLHPAFNALALELAQRAATAEGDDAFRLHIADSLWGQQGYSFLPEFLDVLARNYDAGLQPMDFAAASEEARQVINRWVSEQTEGRIEDLIPQGALTPQTILVLANAVYFNAAWARPFDEADTRPGNFHLLDDSVVQVPMMSQEALFRYALLEGLQAVELPYVGNEVAMVILLPDEGQFEEFEAGLSAGRLAEILQALQPGMVELTMPKFEYRTEYSLADVLAGMGMPSAFSGADFSGMDGAGGLFISEIFHKAFISVDEARTEAAAATGIIAPVAIMEGPGPITVDHPFVFVLRDIPTGSILFVGRVLDPAG